MGRDRRRFYHYAAKLGGDATLAAQAKRHGVGEAGLSTGLIDGTGAGAHNQRSGATGCQYGPIACYVRGMRRCGASSQKSCAEQSTVAALLNRPLLRSNANIDQALTGEHS